MSSIPPLKFSVDEQLQDIENYTAKVQQQVEQLVAEAKKVDVCDATQSVNKIETEVSGMLSDIESHLEQEMNKINQQLQSLLPDDIRKERSL